MRTMGLIGGMSWESTAVYYRLINEMVRTRRGGLASAKVALQSLDFAEVAALQRADRWQDAADLLASAARRLEAAGADCILICTNTMHLVADEVARAVTVPLIDIRDVTGRALAEAGMRRPLLLATRYTMEHGFYADHMRTRFGIDMMTPDARDRSTVHDIIFDELCRGVVLPQSRAAMQEIVRRGADAGADSVILGCTEICLAVTPADVALPVFDSTAIHADAAVDFALGGEDSARLLPAA